VQVSLGLCFILDTEFLNYYYLPSHSDQLFYNPFFVALFILVLLFLETVPQVGARILRGPYSVTVTKSSIQPIDAPSSLVRERAVGPEVITLPALTGTREQYGLGTDSVAAARRLQVNHSGACVRI